MAGSNMSPPLAVMAVVVLSVLLEGSSHAAPEMDPYKILGVTRSASQAEIKKVYKRLAKEWSYLMNLSFSRHPDKNKDPGAEDMFIKITKSYEILSSEDRRANYDRYGQTDDTQAYSSSRYRHRQDNFYFDESFFNFPFNTKNHRDFTDSKYALHFNQYVSEVVPDSYRRPYLIKITSDWCFSCIHIEPVWKEVVQEMEGLGVGIGVVDVGYERRLANHLGAHRTPSILGVISGKVTFFHYAVAKEHLRQFVEDLLPQRVVERITDKNEQQFLSSWHELNKPHVLLFDQVPAVPLLFKLAAFAYKDYLQFGYVDQGLAETAELQKRFNINTYAPTMLVFKENTDKPADIIQAKGMKKQIIDEFMSNNKFLLAPRLVNQKLFDELCPVKQFHRRRKFCVLLMTTDEETYSSGHQEFLSFASTNTRDVVRFAYVYQRLQQPLCDILMHGENSAQSAPQMFVVRWIYASYDYLSEVIDDILHNNWREMMPLLSLIFSALFILFGTVVIQAFRWVSVFVVLSETRPPKKNFVEVTELTDITYISNLVKLRPGHINIVLVLTDASKNILLSKFAKEVYSFTGTQTLHFSFLNLDKHGEWMSTLLEYAQDAAQIDADEDDSGVVRKTDYTGFVLALNGHKKYLCLFKPVYTGEDLDGKSSEDEAGTSAGKPRPGSRDGHPQRKSSRSRSTSTLQIHHKLDRLGLWMERLMEGTLPRYYIPAWPGLDKITPSRQLIAAQMIDDSHTKAVSQNIQ
ncbi:hypothetical protein CCH79_00016851, partial [Gambusia affinis]